MANTETFFKAQMASEDVKSYLGSTRFQKNSVNAEVRDGALVVLGELDNNDVYGLNAKDDNVYLSTAPTADTDDVVIVDIADVSKGDIGGNVYKIGAKNYGFYGAAGEAVRFRRLMKGDRFYVSGDCFESDPTVGKFAVPTANSTKFTPADQDASATKMCVKIEDSRDFTAGANLVGAGRMGKLYLCRVL